MGIKVMDMYNVVGGPRTAVRGFVFNYRTNRNWKQVFAVVEVTEISA